MIDKERSKTDTIIIVPHYLNSLKYYDKLNQDFDVVYLLAGARALPMIDYCKKHNRRFELISVKAVYLLDRLLSSWALSCATCLIQPTYADCSRFTQPCIVREMEKRRSQNPQKAHPNHSRS